MSPPPTGHGAVAGALATATVPVCSARAAWIGARAGASCALGLGGRCVGVVDGFRVVRSHREDR